MTGPQLDALLEAYFRARPPSKGFIAALDALATGTPMDPTASWTEPAFRFVDDIDIAIDPNTFRSVTFAAAGPTKRT